ncbi:cytochrome c oxidase assembly protein [Sinorhizobium meliloti]|uniref:cytochrome c oxidase assembly protein n=1 Tax=Rhizobium meliloti TaxID=382 RepID=UPI000FD98630|nr:cytochrome c oxidase assembly protein [Sinorhizobium meliloti]RVG86727.1 cytochrome c oxidase assembly protein [Sinorhizobium meliloti]RVI35498.1 cytochrome c oxidase assembly protein [Sinorhizobium meliloti]RVI46075.1 cytochrome c oxidase assembly protein [Sinorhizobium meliloti]RVJ29585.1 cytochrome c oxidase assembly protein [Sinorhizobium meliloti]RVK03825.1 cytochrome c oxidase assembly protein [Sinorhizobium meliloti]
MGPLATHMAVHILLMNLAAPLAAFAVTRVRLQRREIAGWALALATFAQIAALWAWHVPPSLNRALEFPTVHLLMNASLFLTAFLFWRVVLRLHGQRSWQPIVALLITSKLYCLLAVLFVFAPRALYPAFAASHAAHATGAVNATLADQQLAGLIMLVACPVTYVLAGIVIAARWLLTMEKDEAGSRTGAAAWT